jgi:hypothetical protein
MICEPSKIIKRPSFDCSTDMCVAEVWIPRSCRHDLDLHAAPHYACTASASWGGMSPTAAIFPHSPLLCVHVSISMLTVYRNLRSLASTSVSDVLFAIASLEQHALVPPPSSPTTGSWLSGHPAAQDESSLVRLLIGRI